MTSHDDWAQARPADPDPFAPPQAGAPTGAQASGPAGPPPYPSGYPSGYPSAPVGYPPAPSYPASAAPYPPPPYGTPYGYPPAGMVFAPPPPLASWAQRVGAFLIDQAVPTVLSLIGLAIWLPSYIRFIRTMTASAQVGTATMQVVSPFGPAYLAMALASLAGLGFTVWNRAFRQGRTGQSLGKQALGLRLVSEQTVTPVGAGTAFLRELAHYLDGVVMYIGYLWPLWDDKRQTFADKICRTVVVADVQRGR